MIQLLSYQTFLSDFFSLFSVTLWLIVFFFAAQFTELGTDVGGAHERLADEHGADASLL